MYVRLPLPQLTLHARRFGGFDDEDELDAAEGLEEEEGQVRAVAEEVHQPLRCSWVSGGGGGGGREMHRRHTQALSQEQPSPG